MQRLNNAIKHDNAVPQIINTTKEALKFPHVRLILNAMYVVLFNADKELIA